MDFASFYDAYWRAKGETVDRHRLKMLARHVMPEDRVLQVDCGPGWLPEMMQAQGAHVIATDLSGVAVEQARARGVDARPFDIDSGPLPFENGEFDVVVSDSQLEHRVDYKHALNEMVRVLRPGGRLVLLLPNTAHWRVRLWLLSGRFPYLDHTPTDPLHLRFFTLPDVRAMLVMRGLTVELVEGSASLWVDVLYPRFLRQGRLSRLYAYLARRWPGLWARDFLVVARKTMSAGGDGPDSRAAMRSERYPGVSTQ
jgi:methionine biosynthesis protein MetW